MKAIDLLRLADADIEGERALVAYVHIEKLQRALDQHVQQWRLGQQAARQSPASGEVERLRGRCAELEEALVESQDWNWITAKEWAEDRNQDFFEIPEMQRLYEIARPKHEAQRLRRQATEIEGGNR